MVRKTHMRKTHKRKSHTRRHTRKRGGACPCAAVNRSLQAGGRGGMGGASVGHAYTTGASQELKQLSPSPLSSGGKGSSARRRTRNAWLYEKNAKKRALLKAIAQKSMPVDIGIRGAMASRVCFPPTSAGAAGCRRNVTPES